MTDIKSTIAELRYLADWAQHHLDKAKIANDAADAIEALQGENERLKASDLAEHNKRLIDNNVYLARRHDEAAGKLRIVEAERDALQAKLDELTKQQPVAYMDQWGEPFRNETDAADHMEGAPTKLYAAPKALEPLTAQAVPWKCINGEACKHGWWCSESYCQEHCVFRSPSMKGDP